MTEELEMTRKRYSALLAKVVANKSLWVAESCGRVLIMTNSSGEALLPVWPDEVSASEVLNAKFADRDYIPSQRSLERWVGEITNKMVEDGLFVGAYPDKDLNCLKVPAKNFAADIRGYPKLQGSDLSRLRRKIMKRRKESGA